jgi:hypothetical protein
MKIKLENGKLFLDGKEITTAITKCGSVIQFPINDTSTVIFGTDVDNNTMSSVDIVGHNNKVTQKNVINGGSIICGGDFHLGDK